MIEVISNRPINEVLRTKAKKGSLGISSWRMKRTTPNLIVVCIVAERDAVKSDLLSLVVFLVSLCSVLASLCTVDSPVISSSIRARI